MVSSVQRSVGAIAGGVRGLVSTAQNYIGQITRAISTTITTAQHFTTSVASTARHTTTALANRVANGVQSVAANLPHPDIRSWSLPSLNLPLPQSSNSFGPPPNRLEQCAQSYGLAPGCSPMTRGNVNQDWASSMCEGIGYGAEFAVCMGHANDHAENVWNANFNDPLGRLANSFAPEVDAAETIASGSSVSTFDRGLIRSAAKGDGAAEDDALAGAAASNVTKDLTDEEVQQIIDAWEGKSGSSGGPGVGRDFTKTTKDDEYADAQGRCRYCGTPVTREWGEPNSARFDHADPRSRQGNNSYDNCNCSCGPCNQTGQGGKGNMTVQEFIRDIWRRMSQGGI